MNQDSPTPAEETIVLRGARFNVHAMSLVGNDGQTYIREVIRHPGAVVILPLLDADTIVMIENQRPTVGETLLELPAGTRESEEPAEQTAIRELREETGYQATSMTLLHEFYSAPGICDELMHLYVARDLTLGAHAREATEKIENHIATRGEIRQWIAEGRIRDAKTLVGLYAFLAGEW
ncbi:ADP-ribose pyrophosphatase [Novipirellula galeiformis]|uniref:GDP-mannose pyrophosphatase n=1 Tax=Novipirellula galeiformis TaxID=2528004 RepID=A0A5C6CJ67_9BACT|nr:NUDIX hydrolase [Novipirellula galeiformis]TWU24185.1 ADP-ribose pyrophosphatase [Novipirellula galeiformis]